MRQLLNRSFRNRLFAAFLAVSLVPLLVCSAMLLQIFRLRMTGNSQASAQEQIQVVLASMDSLFSGFEQAAAQIQNSRLLSQALTGSREADTLVYNELYSAVGEMRSFARFDLYDLQGSWRCSTRQAPLRDPPSTDWGALYAASHGDGSMAFIACEDITDADSPMLQGAVLLESRSGRPVGYLLISMYQSDFQHLLDGKYGTQNDLILLSQYWRPVYCAQPSLAAALAPELRQRLLAGDSLDGVSEDFIYTVASHPRTGLFLVLQQPQVFTHDTMRLLYTVSLTCALICVVISIFMSLKVSRQMFRPIQRLYQGFSEVVQNNLDVRIPTDRNDELGQLAQQFNGMVVALKRNQEQLVENQRELNEAQIRMLQAQLNPHFLCNTLDTMKWISKINKVPQVALMSTNLADILRFCISPGQFVPLKRESDILQRYIEIQKIRLSDSLEFSVELPPALEDCLVPRMILQPIVENSIIHGLTGVAGGKIQVRACETKPGLLCLTVADNGPGFPPDMVGPYFRRDREFSQGHLGLYNVDTILTKYYGEGCGLYLDNAPGGTGAVVTATLPIHREEEAEC